MIIGAHSIIYSKNADADRAFLQTVLRFPSVDVGGGWLIFGLPPGEVAVHPAGEESHELYLMVDDVEGFVADMKDAGVTCDPISPQGWGALTSVTLPGGGKLGVYEPRHARPPEHKAKAAPAAKKKAAPVAKKKAAPVAKKKPAPAPAKKTKTKTKR